MIVYDWKMISDIIANLAIATKHCQRHGSSCEVQKNLTRVNRQNENLLCVTESEGI